jgi:hypothetical protein|tara:strand:- start:653 stop:787 length:135 start_codon:yes stop_codon:yes gene_type:complete
MPSRIIAMTQYRDMVVIACADGTIWTGCHSIETDGLQFQKQAML